MGCYPEGWRDPEWDSTVAGFRDVVIPARIEAITEKLNADLGLPHGMRLEWTAEERFQAVKATACFEADSCVMDVRCPFVAACRAIDDL